MSGVTTTMPLAASSWASRVRPRLVDAGHVRAPRSGARPGGWGCGRRVDARRSDPRGVGIAISRCSTARIEIGQTPRRPLQVRGANDERHAVRTAPVISAAPDSVTVTASSDTTRRMGECYPGFGIREWELVVYDRLA
mgnify:CR=1 FL=1